MRPFFCLPGIERGSCHRAPLYTESPLGTSKRTTHPPAHAGGRSRDRRGAAVLVFSVLFLAFLPCLRNGFVDWDDTDNFLRNPHYRGVGAEQIRWMFTTFHMGHFQPLTWLTLGLDYTWAEAVLGDGK